ncbi:cytochrome P450 [Roridomyces roridus]|uniref:Cytochrome P450 n=1 Tax=Roridomyces roridus TaxID=1738132 RepID=A0AAD7BS34_9AGAR|nr:cytochrome P450 [Roridomyces roridus]
MGTPSLTALALATIALVGGFYTLRARAPSDTRRPPGPRGVPLLGNLLQVPAKHLATYFRQLCEEYGGLVSINLAGFRLMLIGDMALAKELLEKRSIKFSSRPVAPYSLLYDPEQQNWPVLPTGQTHFIGRKLSAGVMAGVRAGETELLQQFDALLCANRLLDGKNWFHELERTSASMVMSAGFGLHCPTGEEPDLKEVLGSIADLVLLSTPSGSIINALPFLDNIPGPWSKPWRAPAAAFRKREDAVYEKLFTRAISGEAAGMNTWASVFASEDKPEGDQRRLLNPYAVAAIETTASTLQSFVLACILFPGWIARAQAELDAVVGPDRIPVFKDRPHLPCVEAVLRETLRWRPALRFGLPHQATSDDVVEYQGKEYFIPKGTIVFAVTWALEHDKSKYENSDEFRPERFLDDKGQLKPGYETSAFGFGRRVCAGQPFADRSLWINIATMLWSFNIRKSSGFKYGCGDASFSGELSNPPLEFPAVFEARSAHHAEVIRQEWADCEKDLNVLLPQHKK